VQEQRWVVPGTHYARTLQAWLERLDANRDEALRILGRSRTPSAARRLLGTWRLFLVSTDEIWKWRGGDEWLVSHYLLSPRAATR
jgi:cyclopropane-fatty-acyl-phospholipid synthase